MSGNYFFGADVPVRTWTNGVPFEHAAQSQIRNIAKLPFIFKHVAVMPDVHFGTGATVGSVIPTTGAVIPAAVGVDIGCGMMAARLALRADQLPDDLSAMRSAIEERIPVGQGKNKELDNDVLSAMARLAPGLKMLEGKHKSVMQGPISEQMGTLGGGNHFVEVCLDKEGSVWIMLHSGSRGVGNRIGRHFIAQAKEDMAPYLRYLPDQDLAFLVEGTQHFKEYVEAVSWAQAYAAENREVMLQRAIMGMSVALNRPVIINESAVRCHHNYISQEHHFGENVWVTRKGAVSAREGQLGIIPGSMGTRSYIVRGKGNADSFTSCSHGAGRAMSRGEAKKRISIERHAEATAGVECRKDESVLDESPDAYKPIEAVMAAQADLVEIVAELKAVLCVKG